MNSCEAAINLEPALIATHRPALAGIILATATASRLQIDWASGADNLQVCVG